MVGAGDIKVTRNRDLVREIQLYSNLTETVRQQNEKIYAIRANVLNVGMTYGLAPYAAMPVQAYFRLVATEPELAAAVRLQATFAIFHFVDIKNADARAAQLQGRLADYLEAAK